MSIYYKSKFENEYIKLYFKLLPFIFWKSSLRKIPPHRSFHCIVLTSIVNKVYILNRLIHSINKYFLSKQKSFDPVP